MHICMYMYSPLLAKQKARCGSEKGTFINSMNCFHWSADSCLLKPQSGFTAAAILKFLFGGFLRRIRCCSNLSDVV